MAASSVKEILKLRQQLEERDSARNNSYDESVKFYAGSDLKTAKKQGFVGGIMQGLSSIFSAPSENEDAELRTPINVIKGAVENKVAFLALPPTVRVIEPPDTLAPASQSAPSSQTGLPEEAPASGLGAQALPPGLPAPPELSQTMPGMPPEAAPEALSGPVEREEDWGIQLADRLECVLKSIMDFSNMPKRCRDVAWSMSVMDGAVIGVWPDFKHGKPRIFTRTPQDFYPVSADPDGLELSKAVWTEELNGHDISARWQNDKYIGRDDVKVTFYIDEEKFCTILDDKEWAHSPVDNTVGFVPIVCVGSLGMPGMVFGGNDVRDAIPIAKEINYHMSLLDDIAASTINPTVVITDPLNVSNFVALGQGGVIEVNPGGRVDTVGPMTLPNAFWQLGATLQNWLDVVMDNPAVLRGESGSSIVTGKGFNSQLGPIAARMQTRLEIVMSAWRQTLKYALMMWADFPGVNGKLKASGVKNNETFYIEAEPADFMVDGHIWTELDVFLSAQSYIDRQGNSVELMQLVQNELISRDTAMDNLTWVTNKKRENANIDRDREWKAQGMAIANAAAQSPMTANVPLMSQEATNYGLERGFMGETPPMPGPEAQMPAEGAPPEGMPPEMAPPEVEGMTLATGPEGEVDTAAEVVAAMQEFFAGIPKLKGSVWFGGDPILAPEKIVSTEWTVAVWVTDPADQGTITRAAEKVEEVYGHIKFIRGVPAPDEQAIQVAGEGGGPEGQPTEEPPPDLSGTPDLEAMMGGM